MLAIRTFKIGTTLDKRWDLNIAHPLKDFLKTFFAAANANQLRKAYSQCFSKLVFRGVENLGFTTVKIQTQCSLYLIDGCMTEKTLRDRFSLSLAFQGHVLACRVKSHNFSGQIKKRLHIVSALFTIA